MKQKRTDLAANMPISNIIKGDPEAKIEIDAPIAEAPMKTQHPITNKPYEPRVLISLEEHNNQFLNEEKIKYHGIACPDCGKALFDADQYIIDTYPARRAVGCFCGFKGMRYCQD